MFKAAIANLISNCHSVRRSKKVHRSILHGAIVSHTLHLIFTVPEIHNVASAVASIGVLFVILESAAEKDDHE